MNYTKGFTLLELLLFVSVAGVTVSVISFFLIQINRLNTANQVSLTVTQDVTRIAQEITEFIESSPDIVSPDIGEGSSTTLELTQSDGTSKKLIFDNNNLAIQFGSSPARDQLNNPLTQIDTLSFEAINTDNSDLELIRKGIRFSFTLSYKAPTGAGQSFEYNQSRSFSDVAYLDNSVRKLPITNNLELWLKSDKGIVTDGSSSTLIEWKDQSGNDRHVANSTSNNRPSVVSDSINANPAVFFDGTGQYLVDEDAEGYLDGLEEVTLITLVKSEEINSDSGFITTMNPDNNDDYFGIRFDTAGANGGQDDVIKPAISGTANKQALESSANAQTTDWLPITLQWQRNTNLEMYLNFILDTPSHLESSFDTPTGLNEALYLGLSSQDSIGTQSWNGYIAEILLYSSKLTPVELESIHDYLSYKYGLEFRLE